MSKLRGALIVIEGLDRSGKSSQVKNLVNKLLEKGFKAEARGFPDRRTALGKVIDGYLKSTNNLEDHAIHLLFSANRWESKAEMISLLEGGTTLVVDRYAFSGAAFSSAKVGMSIDWCRQSDIGLPKPDVVCFLTADVEVLKGRGGFGDERYEKEEFQKIVSQRFQELKDPSWIEINADQAFEKVSENLLTIALKTIESSGRSSVGKLWS